jgi:hypothetical protein
MVYFIKENIMENITITPIVGFDIEVPELSEEQRKSLNELKDTEVSTVTANYLIKLNYARKREE